MYQPAHFVEERPEILQALLREHPLGLLITVADDGPRADPVPFVLDVDPAGGPGILRAHVARANPLWRDSRSDIDSLIVFQGPQGYVSPSWYPSKAEHHKVVPIWNYVTAQGRGRLRAIDDAEWLRAFVTRLTTQHEAPQRQPWAVTDAPPAFIDSMLGAIVGIEITLSSLVGKWKVSQNRSGADRSGVASGLREKPIGDARSLAEAVERFTPTPRR